jgi:hypothetical protein
MTELFALKSLGNEVLGADPNNVPPTTAAGGLAAARVGSEGMGNALVANEWLEEHMVTGYEGGWFTLNPGDDEDASISTDTSSRLLNYCASACPSLSSLVCLYTAYLPLPLSSRAA